MTSEKYCWHKNTEALLETFQIKSDTNERGTYYYALGTNQANTVKVAHTLEFVDKALVYNKKHAGGTTTCTGCTEGCNPKLGGDGYYFCTSCTEGTGCSKSTTVSTTFP